MRPTSDAFVIARRAVVSFACIAALGGCGSCVKDEPPAPSSTTSAAESRDASLGAVKLLGRGVDPDKLVARDAGASSPSP